MFFWIFWKFHFVDFETNDQIKCHSDHNQGEAIDCFFNCWFCILFHCKSLATFLQNLFLHLFYCFVLINKQRIIIYRKNKQTNYSCFLERFVLYSKSFFRVSFFSLSVWNHVLFGLDLISSWCFRMFCVRVTSFSASSNSLSTLYNIRFIQEGDILQPCRSLWYRPSNSRLSW